MSDTFQLNPHVECIRISGAEFLIRGGHLEGYSLIVEDDGDGIAEAIFAADRAPVSVDTIARQVDDPPAVQRHVDDLLAAGVLVAAGGGADAQAAWTAFARYGTVPPAHLVRPLEIVGDGLAEQLASSLDECGIGATAAAVADIGDLSRFAWEEGAPADAEAAGDGPGSAAPPPDTPVLVVATERQSIGTMQELNTRAVTAGAPVLYVQSSGAQLVVGPYVHPGQSACFWEFELQRSRSMFKHSHYQAVLQLNGRSAATTSRFVTQAAVYAAMPWVVELGLTSRSGLLGRALIGRTTTVELRAQTVLRLPRCPVCLPLRPLLRNPVI